MDKLRKMDVEVFQKFINKSEDQITQSLSQTLLNLFKIESDSKNLTETLKNYSTVDLKTYKAQSSFAEITTPEDYDLKIKEEMTQIVSSQGDINGENLSEVFQKCSEVLRNYVIAIGADNIEGRLNGVKVVNSIGDFLDSHVSKDQIENLKKMNSSFTSKLDNWASEIVNIVTIQKRDFQPLKYFILKSIVNVLDKKRDNYALDLQIILSFN